MNDHTRLRLICSEDPFLTKEYVNNLPYKIEIKGNPVQNIDGKWYLYFIPPEELKTEIPDGDLD